MRETIGIRDGPKGPSYEHRPALCIAEAVVIITNSVALLPCVLCVSVPLWYISNTETQRKGNYRSGPNNLLWRMRKKLRIY
jgi:hypothetical protein